MAEEIDITSHLLHVTSEVICINCKYRWIAVRPEITKLKKLECPNCGEQGFVIETGEVINSD